MISFDMQMSLLSFLVYQRCGVCRAVKLFLSLMFVCPLILSSSICILPDVIVLEDFQLMIRKQGKKQR